MSEKVLVRNASDEAQVENANVVIKKRGDGEREALAFLLASYPGRQFLHWLLVQCGYTDLGVFQLSYLGDTNAMLVAEGRREVGQHVLGAIHALAPQAVLQIMDEARKRRETK